MTINPDLHPSVAAKLELFVSDHLSPKLAHIAIRFEQLAHAIASEIAAHPQLTLALQKLLEAKDETIRAKSVELRAAGEKLKNAPEPGVAGDAVG